MARTPQEAFRDNILAFEGAPRRDGSKFYYQALATDVGNIIHLPDGSIFRGPNVGRVKAAAQRGAFVVGTNYGVTPGAYAAFRGMRVEDVTVEDMKNLDLAVATEIGVRNYFVAPGFDRLPWGPVVEAVADFGWGSGPQTAIRVLQRIVGAVPDGVLGAKTVAAFLDWFAKVPVDQAVNIFADARVAFYRAIPPTVSNKGKFTPGWVARANYFRPTNAAWWGGWIDGAPVPAAEHGAAEAVPKAGQAEPPAPRAPVLPELPEGYWRNPDTGNLERLPGTSSTIEQGANQGTIVAAGTAATGAASGLATLFKVVPPWAAGGALLLVAAAGVAIAYYFLFIRRRRQAMTASGAV